MADGTVRCWGANSSGQLGDRSKTNRNTPVEVRGLSKVAEVGVGGGHACARNREGIVHCWGRNDWGQLGDGHVGKRALRTRPGPVAGLLDATSLAVGFGQAYGMFADGTAVCWGGGDQGQLGLGRAGAAVRRLQKTPSVVGGEFTCVLTRSNSVHCFGDNQYGQLGDGTTQMRSKPGPVQFGSRSEN